MNYRSRSARWFTVQKLWFVVSFVYLVPLPASAQDFERRLSQYAHSAWRLQDGALSGVPNAIAQTADGYLWIGTSTGLVRFDGIRLVPWVPSDGSQTVPSSIYSLLGTSDGSLWIGGSGGSGLSRLKDGRLTSFSNARGRINTIVQGSRGSIWMTRTRATDEAAPLCSVGSDQPLRCYGKADGLPLSAAVPLIADAEGNFWLAGNGTVVRWRQGESATYAPSQLRPAAQNAVGALASAADGSVWVGIPRSGSGLG